MINELMEKQMRIDQHHFGAKIEIMSRIYGDEMAPWFIVQEELNLGFR